MTISAIVTTYNRKALLARCLDSLMHQEYADYEVIVVDDASTDGTDQFLQQFKDVPKNVTFRFFRQKINSGIGPCRTTGVKTANGKIVAFTDDDSVVSRDWIAKIAEYLHDFPEVAGVGGLVRNGHVNSVIAEVNQQITTFHLHDKLLGGGYTRFLVGNNMSLRKSVVEEVGYFGEETKYGGTDVEIEVRVMSLGYKLMFAPDIVVTHFQRNSLKSFLRQHYQYGVGEYVLYLSKRNIDELAKSTVNFRNLTRVVTKPYKVSKYLSNAHEKCLCYPLVYLATLARTTGFIAGKLGARNDWSRLSARRNGKQGPADRTATDSLPDL